MEKNKRTLGSWYEDMAASYLEKQGLFILERNYRVRTGEIDLIARDGEYLVFVEVKYRCTGSAGEAICAVGVEKQRSISRTAAHYLAVKIRAVDVPCRFDVIGIDGREISWIRDAFDYRW